MPSREAAIAARAMRQSVTNIMTAEPTRVTTPVMVVARELLRVCCRVSTSLVTRERVSPVEPLSM